MRKEIKVIYCILFLSTVSYAQNDCVSHCESEQGYSRSVFCSDYVYHSDEKGIIATSAGFEWSDTLTFIDVSLKDADLIEFALKGYLALYAEQSYQRDIPFIRSNLNRYNRQFFSYLNKSGETVVMINFFWKDKDYHNLGIKRPVFVDDGGHFFWKVQHNLKTKKFFGLKVNGRA